MANGWGGKRNGAGAPKRVGVTQVARSARVADSKARESIGMDAVTPMAKATAGGKFQDSFVNYTHRLGLGAQNILSSSSSSFNPLTRIRTLVEWMYRGQFVCKNAIDVIPEDMTRQGVILNGPMKPKDIRKMDAEATKLNLWTSVRSVLKWSRLYGGCLGFIIIANQDPSTPLRIETVGKDQFKGIFPLDRWMVDPSLELLVTDFASPQFGKPMFYRVTADAPALPRMKIHHSRVIRLVGNELPYWQAIQENLWGLSVLETIQDRINAFDIGSSGAAQLIDKSFIRTYKLKGLKELVGSNEVAMEGVRALLEVMRSQQGIEGVTLMDLEDEYEGHEHAAFAGLAEILQEFRQQLSGALQMPQTKLFGTSPAGMNATGESDMRNYYDMIKARQIADLLYPMTVVYQLMAQSLGIKWNEEMSIAFKSLWQPTELEKATIAKTITETILAAEEKGTVSTKTAMQELKQQSHETGVWTNITEEDIEAAADVPVPAAGIVMPGMEDQPPVPGGPPPGGKKPAPAKGKSRDAAWTGSAGGTEERHAIPYSEPGYPPNVLPKPDVMPSGVMPGARPFDDAACGPVTCEFHGLKLHIENQRGTTRTSRDPANPWQAIMAADYGYVIGTGSAEGPDEGMDCFLGPDRGADTVYIINQKDLRTGFFDEHKCMLGFSSQARACAAYVSSYSDLQGVDRIMSVHRVSMNEFKTWLGTGHLRKPYGKA
jgi:phage-related protein (TIGR01555 family)